MKTPLVGIEGREMSVEGALNLPVIIITYSKCCILQQTFMMIKIDLAYNVILGRSFFLA
jgi:hypothetical protein